MTDSILSKFLFITLLITCFSFATGYCQQPDFTLTQSERWKPSFPPGFEKGLYKTKLEIGKNKLSGMMFIKRLADTSIRIVFTNEIGMTFFDLELSGQGCTVHAIFPSMDKPSFLKILEEDLRILVFRDQTISKMTLKKDRNVNFRIFRTRSKRGTSTYFVERDSHHIIRQKAYMNRIRRTEILYNYGDPGIPVKIDITNPTIGLHISMSLLNN